MLQPELINEVVIRCMMLPSLNKVTRLSNFAHLLRPVLFMKRCLVTGPIQPDQWYRALKRYKPTAARGVDGISHKEIFSHSL